MIVSSVNSLKRCEPSSTTTGQTDAGADALKAALPSTALSRPGCLAGSRLSENAACGAQRGAPLMTGALMSARNDMEAAEPNVAQLHERVELTRVDTCVSTGGVA